jgi:ribosome-associated protein
MLHINRNIAIERDEIQEEFIRASGPGGQNVNKVATAVQLRFDAAGSPSLPEEVKQRLLKIARNKITDDGILVIEAKRFRSQRANRRDALDRFVRLIRNAAKKPVIRRKTRPTKASQERRLESKKRRSATKRLRRRVDSSGY